MSPPKYDLFCFTWNNYGDDALKYIHEKLERDCQWLAYGREIAPTTGTPHLQGIYWLQVPKTQQQMYRKFHTRGGWTHFVTNQDKDPQYWMDYITKEDKDPYASGTPPTKEQWENYMKFIGERRRTDLETSYEDIKKTKKMRDFMEVPRHMQSIRVAEKYLEYKEDPRRVDPQSFIVTWIFGPTESGKTRLVRFLEKEEEIFRPTSRKWWQGYDRHEVLLLDDFRKDWTTFHDLLSPLLDIYPFRVEVKGGSRQAHYMRVYITSPYHPEQVYSTREDVEQLIRRIHNIWFCGYEEFRVAKGSLPRSFKN